MISIPANETAALKKLSTLIAQCTSHDKTLETLQAIADKGHQNLFEKVVQKVTIAFDFNNENDKKAYVSISSKLNLKAFKALNAKARAKYENQTALDLLASICLQTGDLEIYIHLWEKMKKTDDNFKEMLFAHAKAGHLDIVKHLTKDRGVYLTQAQWLTLLKTNQTDVVKYFVESDSQVLRHRVFDPNLDDLLMLGARHGTKEMVAMLLSLKIFEIRQNTHGDNFVMQAVKAPNIGVLTFCIEKAKEDIAVRQALFANNKLSVNAYKFIVTILKDSMPAAALRDLESLRVAQNISTQPRTPFVAPLRLPLVQTSAVVAPRPVVAALPCAPSMVERLGDLLNHNAELCYLGIGVVAGVVNHSLNPQQSSADFVKTLMGSVGMITSCIAGGKVGEYLARVFTDQEPTFLPNSRLR